MFSCLVFLAVFAAAQGRAVNISNTWVLPEEGFPVFYRYFRDRISWYEADAVCQFHHANLVTVDTTAQYDAVRAYLKELDISTAVWVGLIRSNPDGEFTWTDYRGLSGEGYWSSAPDSRTAPLCAAAAPAADYRWEARPCGGPTVASFICELPVPQWALGNEGCMIRNLPALTVLYLPESAAVQLTADCGLAEAKKVQCTGNMKREVLLKNLACDEEETTTGALKIESSDITTERDNTNEMAIEDITTTKQEDLASSPKTPIDIDTTTKILPKNEDKKVYMTKNINIDFINHNNIQSNDIPRIAGNDDDFIEEQRAKLEDERTKQQIMIHEHIARHGTLDGGDHFVPPLVMAKAKISDDMTVLSLQEKHAQQLAEQGVLNFKNTHKEVIPLQKDVLHGTALNDEEMKSKTIDMTVEITNNVKKDIKPKSQIPKKYNEKYISVKGKYTNPLENIKQKNEEEKYIPPAQNITHSEPITTVNINEFYKVTTDLNPIDLTVIFKEPAITKNAPPKPSTAPDINIDNTQTLAPEKAIINKTKEPETESQAKGYSLNDEIIKITIIKGADDPSPFTTKVFEVTTKVPVFETSVTPTDDSDVTTTTLSSTSKQTLQPKTSESTTVVNSVATTANPTSVSEISEVHVTSHVELTSEIPISNETSSPNNTLNDLNVEVNVSTVVVTESGYNMTYYSNTTEEHETDSLDDPIDDENSPLLSGASEPLHRPPRLRRPQQQSKAKKFNPFRILG